MIKPSSLKTREQVKSARREVQKHLALSPKLSAASRTELYELHRQLGLRENEIVEAALTKG